MPMSRKRSFPLNLLKTKSAEPPLKEKSDLKKAARGIGRLFLTERSIFKKPAPNRARFFLIEFLIFIIATSNALILSRTDFESNSRPTAVWGRSSNTQFRGAYRAIYHPDLLVTSSLLIAAWTLGAIAGGLRERNQSIEITARRRRFKLADIMILTAGSAVGLALARYYLKTPSVYVPTLDKTGDMFMIPGFRSWTHTDIATTCSLVLIPLSIALICIDLREHSLQARSWFLDPGLFAMWVATALVIVIVGEGFVDAVRHGWPAFEIPAFGRGGVDRTVRIDLFPTLILPALKYCVGIAVIFAWLLLALCRRWSKPKSWVDFAGLSLGAAWILLFVESLF